MMPIGKDETGAFVPIIDQLNRQIRNVGVTEIVVVVNYLAESILRHLETNAAIKVGVSHVDNPSKFEKPADMTEWGHLAKSGMMVLYAELAQLPREISLTPSGEYTTTGIIQHCLMTGKFIDLVDIALCF